MISHVPIISNTAPANQYTQATPSQTNKSNTQVTTTSAPTQQTTVVQQSTTNTGNNVNKGANVNMNINLNGGINSSSSYTETSTTTVHSTGGAPAQQTNVYVLPGYNGPTGCPWPMSDGDFANARNSVNAKSFEDTKLTVAKQIFDHNCMLSSQVRDIMSTFDFEATKLEFAKYAYGRTFDIGNYYKVNDVFDFESSISDLNAYINNYRR
jgi:hypothetical protein